MLLVPKRGQQIAITRRRFLALNRDAAKLRQAVPDKKAAAEQFDIIIIITIAASFTKRRQRQGFAWWDAAGTSSVFFSLVRLQQLVKQSVELLQGFPAELVDVKRAGVDAVPAKQQRRNGLVDTFKRCDSFHHKKKFTL
jgi:hypothetical protein